MKDFQNGGQLLLIPGVFVWYFLLKSAILSLKLNLDLKLLGDDTTIMTIYGVESIQISGLDRNEIFGSVATYLE